MAAKETKKGTLNIWSLKNTKNPNLRNQFKIIPVRVVIKEVVKYKNKYASQFRHIPRCFETRLEGMKSMIRN